jgi:hypothetical protein
MLGRTASLAMIARNVLRGFLSGRSFECRSYLPAAIECSAFSSFS